LNKFATVLFILWSLWANAIPAVAQSGSGKDKAARDLKYQGEMLMGRGDYGAARVVLLRASKLNPNDPELFLNLGRATYNTMERFGQGVEEAEGYLLKSMTLDPTQSRVFAHLAELKVIQGKHQEAVDYANRGIKNKNVWADCYYYKAVALSNLKRGAESLATIDQYLSLCHPTKRSLALETKASILENMGRYSDALPIYEEVYKDKKQDTYLFRESNCLEKMGKPLQAAKVLDKLIVNNPQDEAALVQRARLYVKAGDLKSAEADYSRAIAELPIAAYYKERAALYKKMGRLDLYQKDLKSAAAL
jgi:tetratricopeptide (TPR) repeat protein